MQAIWGYYSIILFATLFHLRTGRTISFPESIDFAYLRKFYLLLPLYRCRRFARDVVNYAVDAVYFVYDAARDVF